jgi:hypothetical protein
VNPIDVVLDRLSGHRVRPHGNERWRACCPAHQGSNPSALSVGVGREGQVLLRCWSGCEVDAIAAALGLELEELFPPRQSAAGRPPKRRLISAGQALDLLDAEMITFGMYVALCRFKGWQT